MTTTTRRKRTTTRATPATPPSYRDTQSEAALQGVAVEMAERLGFLWYHTPDSRRTNPGHPDVHFVGHGLSLFVEFKRTNGRLRPEQRQCIAEMRRAGDWVEIVRPADMDRLEAILRNAASVGFRTGTDP